MAYISKGNTECMKFCKEFGDFHRQTQVFVKAIRRACHGILEEQEKMEVCSSRAQIKLKVLPRHENIFKKIAVGLQDYTENFITVRSRYEEIFGCRSKHAEYDAIKVENIYRRLSSQRDVLLHGILMVIRVHLRCASKHFDCQDLHIEGEPIFKLIGIYNTLLVKLQQCPQFTNPDNSKEKTPSTFRNFKLLHILPDAMNSSAKLKRITASNILQVVGLARSAMVKESILSALFSIIVSPLEENGTRLPWKPIFYDGITSLPLVDIFEEAIAKEEDEYARNQRKLDMALKLEFGEDFPAADYRPSSTSTNHLLPINNQDLDDLNSQNARLFLVLTRKFLHTPGVLVTTMSKRNKSGKLRLVKAAKTRLESYFAEKMWGPGTEKIEEIIIWFPNTHKSHLFAPPAILSVLQIFRFLNNIYQYCDRGLLPESCESSCQNIVDECRHIGIMSFMDGRLVRGFGPYSRTDPGTKKMSDSNNYCTEGGESLVESTEMLVYQINEIEKPEPEKEPKDWPIAEEIGFMLCLCSLIGSLISFSKIRGSYLLHTWNTAPFFLVTQADLPRVIDKARKLMIKERDNLVKTDDVGRLQLVIYRENVVNRITALIDAIKALEEQTVADVSSVCRTVSLAQLQNSMPEPKVWKSIGRIPHESHEYVYEYIGTVLEPVLDAVTKLGVVLQKRAGSTMLKVVCYSWLEHIKAQKIKFSLWGAQQLLKDFYALAEWLRKYPGLEPEARSQILAVDVLRECEGVARLLMRQPPLVVGYTSHNQVAPLAPISAGRKRDKELRLSTEDDDIPAEMYVPNQQLWLNLRARSTSGLIVRLAGCCSWPY